MNILDNVGQSFLFEFKPNPEFGTAHLPVVLSAEIGANSENLDVIFDHYKNIEISPFCNTLHYGQSVFEGMKAFRIDDKKVGIFRPEAHAKRFIRSNQIMKMNVLNENFFLECLYAYVEKLKEYVPTLEGHTLYLRPLLYSTDRTIKVKVSKKYRLIIMSSVVGDYFAKNPAGQKVLINKNFVRAFPNGVGEAKTAANYALSLPALDHANSKGYEQVLYVDAQTKTNLEELGGMNFFYVKDNKVITPKLDGTILHGVTRTSVLEIAKHLGFETKEENINLDKFLSETKQGLIKEAFATGTAASIAYLSTIGVESTDGLSIENFNFPDRNVAMKLREYLVATQRNKTEHSKNWLKII